VGLPLSLFQANLTPWLVRNAEPGKHSTLCHTPAPGETAGTAWTQCGAACFGQARRGADESPPLSHCEDQGQWKPHALLSVCLPPLTGHMWKQRLTVRHSVPRLSTQICLKDKCKNCLACWFLRPYSKPKKTLQNNIVTKRLLYFHSNCFWGNLQLIMLVQVRTTPYICLGVKSFQLQNKKTKCIPSSLCLSFSFTEHKSQVQQFYNCFEDECGLSTWNMLNIL